MTGKASTERMKPKKPQRIPHKRQMAYKMCKSRTRRVEIREHMKVRKEHKEQQTHRMEHTQGMGLMHHMGHMQNMEHMEHMEHMQSTGPGMEFRRMTTRRPSNSTGR